MEVLRSIAKVMASILMIGICFLGYLCVGLGAYYVIKVAIRELRG